MPQQVRSPADPRLIDTHGPKWVLKVVNILRGREGERLTNLSLLSTLLVFWTPATAEWLQMFNN